MSTLRANIKPALLRWARAQSRLTVEAAARKIGVSADALQAWESDGDPQMPTIRQLREAARVYRYSLAVFFLPEPPADAFQPIRDFRHLPGQASGTVSPELHMAIRDAYDKRESALELFEVVEESPPRFEFRASTGTPPEMTAGRLRQFLGITDEAQRRWREPSKALLAIRQRLESHGVMVLQVTRVGLEEFRGFAIHAAVLPIVVVNRADAAAGRLFSLIHEATHLALGSSGICNASDHDGSEEGIEVYCNAVAGALLVPTEQLLRLPLVEKHAREAWTLGDLERVATAFAVSRFVIVRRLFDLGRIGRSEFARLNAALEEEFARLPKKKGRTSPASDVVSLSGTILPSLVLQAFGAERISASSVASYLNVRLKHVPDIQQLLDRTI